MRVLFLSRYQFPFVRSGGTGVVVYELMNALRNRGVDLEHWTWPPPADSSRGPVPEAMRSFPPLAEVSACSPRTQKVITETLTNLSMIREYDNTPSFDVIHVHTWELYLAGLLAKYLWEKPLVFTTHDVMQGDRAHEVHDIDIYLYSVLAERVLARECDAIVNVSKENRLHFAGLYPGSLTKSTAIPNGVNVDTFSPTKSRIEFDRYNIGLRKPYVLFLGRASRQKGIHHLLEAMPYLRRDIPIVFALSTRRWDGAEYGPSQQYVERIKKYTVEREDTFLICNEWDRSRLREIYSHAAFTVMPSIHETCGMVAQESQACGTPVIANNLGFMRDSIVHGETGILINYRKDDVQYPQRLAFEINALWESADFNRMGKLAEENARKHHSWKQRSAEHIQLYERLTRK